MFYFLFPAHSHQRPNWTKTLCDNFLFHWKKQQKRSFSVNSSDFGADHLLFTAPRVPQVPGPCRWNLAQSPRRRWTRHPRTAFGRRPWDGFFLKNKCFHKKSNQKMICARWNDNKKLTDWKYLTNFQRGKHDEYPRGLYWRHPETRPRTRETDGHVGSEIPSSNCSSDCTIPVPELHPENNPQTSTNFIENQITHSLNQSINQTISHGNVISVSILTSCSLIGPRGPRPAAPLNDVMDWWLINLRLIRPDPMLLPSSVLVRLLRRLLLGDANGDRCNEKIQPLENLV